MFGVSNCADRGWALRTATDLAEPHESDIYRSRGRRTPTLPDAALLHSRSRRDYMSARDRFTGYFLSAVAEREQARPIRHVGNGQLHIRARPLTPRWARTAIAETGRSMVVLTFGESDDDVEVVGVSIPDARRLLTMISTALDAPFPGPGQ